MKKKKKIGESLFKIMATISTVEVVHGKLNVLRNHDGKCSFRVERETDVIFAKMSRTNCV